MLKTTFRVAFEKANKISILDLEEPTHGEYIPLKGYRELDDGSVVVGFAQTNIEAHIRTTIWYEILIKDWDQEIAIDEHGIADLKVEFTGPSHCRGVYGTYLKFEVSTIVPLTSVD